MKKTPTCERELQLAWKTLKRGASFKSLAGRQITVLTPGTWNFEEGPDFKNAKFSIDGAESSGDVEIHLRTSDWEHHGHASDPNYRNVRLHAVHENDWNQERLGTHGIEVILLDNMKRIGGSSGSEQRRFGGGACVKFFSRHDDATLHSFFRMAGVERLRTKSAGIAAEMINDGADTTILGKLFESAGYKKNKDNFIELFTRCREHGDIAETDLAEAVLWGESGLLPDPTVDAIAPEMKPFASKVWKLWWKNRIGRRRSIRWIKNGIRPLNSPERRIAGLCGIMRRLGTAPVKKMTDAAGRTDSPATFAGYLVSMSICSDDLWDGWTNFRDKRNVRASVVGEMRAVDIAANVFLPCLHARSGISKDQNMRMFYEDAFCSLPLPQGNIKIKTAVNKWFMPPSREKNIITDAAAAQGVLHILKNFCEKSLEDCVECRLAAAFHP